MNNSSWRITGGAPLRGFVDLPGDKSIAHRALMLAALAEGTSEIEGLPDGEDVDRTQAALRALGVRIDRAADVARVHGVGLDGLLAPSATLDCGNSGTTLRLMAGLLAGCPFEVCLDGDASLRRRPMRRLVEPLSRMGARIQGLAGLDGEIRAPLRMTGGLLVAVDHDLPIASAQVKSALLLAGLRASGRTRVREPMPSRDHTERLLAQAAAPIRADVGGCVLETSRWDRRLRPLRLRLPGDLSSAAFFCVGALVVPGSDVSLRDVGANPTRTGCLEVLRAMGARLAIRAVGENTGVEPRADLRITAGELIATDVRGVLALRAMDEIPALCVAATQAVGRTGFFDVGELRTKESDRIAAISKLLAKMGARVEPHGDGLSVDGRTQLQGVAFGGHDFGADHRIVMSLAIAALCAHGDSEIASVETVQTSFPGFSDALARLGAKLTAVERPC